MASSSAAGDFSGEAEAALPISKCCASVVPKKRKRHIEMKHRSALIRSKLRRQQQSLTRQQQNMPSDIYIDLDQTSPCDADSSLDRSEENSPDNQRLVLKVGQLLQCTHSYTYTCIYTQSGKYTRLFSQAWPIQGTCLIQD